MRHQLHIQKIILLFVPVAHGHRLAIGSEMARLRIFRIVGEDIKVNAPAAAHGRHCALYEVNRLFVILLCADPPQERRVRIIQIIAPTQMHRTGEGIGILHLLNHRLIAVIHLRDHTLREYEHAPQLIQDILVIFGTGKIPIQIRILQIKDLRMEHFALRKTPAGCLSAQMKLPRRLSPDRITAHQLRLLLWRTHLIRQIPKPQQLTFTRCQHVLLPIRIKPGKVQLHVLPETAQLAI